MTPSIVLSVNDLCININNHRIVNHLTWNVRQGERWVILGANGCGKSTLLKVCAGLPIRGMQVTHQNITLEDGNKHHRSYCPQHLDWNQDLTVFQLSQLLNININNDDIVLNLLRLLPKLWLYQPLSYRSGGEQQRIAIALTMVRPSNLILLDEPLTYLDEVWQLKVLDYLKQSSKTIVMVSHHLRLSLKFATHLLLPYQQKQTGAWHMVDIKAINMMNGNNIHLIEAIANAYQVDIGLARQLLEG